MTAPDLPTAPDEDELRRWFAVECLHGVRIVGSPRYLLPDGRGSILLNALSGWPGVGRVEGYAHSQGWFIDLRDNRWIYIKRRDSHTILGVAEWDREKPAESALLAVYAAKGGE